MYEETKTSTAGYLLLEYYKGINHHFGIDWMSTTWEDLRMPLYSGLGARLYIQLSAKDTEIPRPIEEQGTFWESHYRSGGNPNDFIVAAEQLEQGETGTRHPVGKKTKLIRKR